MPTDQGPDDVIARYLGGEISTMNAQLPKVRKTLSELLHEEHPRVPCLDGSEHSFKLDELKFLASILDDRERDELLLPMIIEVHSGRSEMLIRSRQGVEAKVFARVLDMPVAVEKTGVRIYRSQLGSVRRTLKTATQYVFTL
ncbi:MAG: DUF61 family protein [Bacteriovoracaceae bacterium]|jgi:uncharacterized protein (UPF0216 family)|nr:DUF61 family protein [Bacteriovoracaceae bacterium]